MQSLTGQEILDSTVGGDEDVRLVQDPPLEYITMSLPLLSNVLPWRFDKLQRLVPQEAVAQVAWHFHRVVTGLQRGAL